MRRSVNGMPIRAVVFDIGGVLERIDDPRVAPLSTKWRRLLGMSEADFKSALLTVDPDDRATTGQLSEPEFTQRYATALGLTPAQTAEFMADMWDWYCGELDTEMMAFAASLRPRLRTAILSNSADGARREEESRYQFGELFDPVIYSHEVGLAKPDPDVFRLTCARVGVPPDELIFIDDSLVIVEAAGKLGIHAIHHTSTPA